MTRKARSLIALGLVIAAGAATLLAAGCQTMEGIGNDLKYMGEKTEEVVRK
ncbi:MAG: hypothetical protein WC718_06950 [Phycisphaerales bacterium]|jgi:predicted small secreted protein